VNDIHYIYFSQNNYILKSWFKAACFDLKIHRQSKLRTRKFFTMWLCAFVIPEPPGIPKANSHIVKIFLVFSLA